MDVFPQWGHMCLAVLALEASRRPSGIAGKELKKAPGQRPSKTKHNKAKPQTPNSQNASYQGGPALSALPSLRVWTSGVSEFR